MTELFLLPILENFKDELIKTYKNSKDEIKHLINDGLQEYMVNQHSKIAKVNYKETGLIGKIQEILTRMKEIEKKLEVEIDHQEELSNSLLL